MASALSSARQQRMQPMSVLLALAGVLGAASWRSEMEPVLRQPQRAVALLPPLDALHHLTRLRGGADDEDDLLEEDEESDDALAESDGAGMDGLENPFLQGRRAQWEAGSRTSPPRSRTRRCCRRHSRSCRRVPSSVPGHRFQ